MSAPPNLSSVSSMGWGSSTSIISWTILSLMCFRDLFLQPLLLLHLLPIFLFLQQQFHWDLHNAYFMGSYCEQSLTIHPKSIPKYKYLSALGVSVLVNTVRFGLTCMSKMDGVCMLSVGVHTESVASHLSFCFLRSKYYLCSTADLWSDRFTFYVLLVIYNVVFQL